MAKSRSPNYPAIDLGAALAAIEPAFRAENRNKMGKMPLARHLGYSSLNGRALAKIGAVRAYGLIEGSGDEVRVSEDAIAALMAPPGAPERQEAIARLALRPSLYREIKDAFPDSLPSEQNLSFWLVRNGYTPEASGKAAKAYLETMRLVTEPGAAYKAAPEPAEDADVDVNEETVLPATGRTRLAGHMPPQPGTRQAIFTLDEGDVYLTFPSDMSADGYRELKAYLDIFLRKAESKAGKGSGAVAVDDNDLI